MRNTVGFFITTLVLFISTSCHFNSEPTAEEISAISAKLHSDEKPGFVRPGLESLERWKALGRIYESRGYRSIWVVRGAVQPGVENLKQTLSQASLHGLNPGEYTADSSSDPTEQELELSWSLLQLAFDVANSDAPVESLVAQAIAEDRLTPAIDQLAPQDPQYQGLKKALQQYRQSGAPPEQLRQIALNMNRLRQLPSDLGRRHVLVNIPEYKLRVVEDGSDVLTMNVVVGKVETRTPVFSANMTHVVFSPYWNIPQSILKNETLPKVLEDKNYLARQNIEVMRVSGGKRETLDASDIDWSDEAARSRYHFRQKPGAANSLGLVKFMLPNSFDVYLHDTPADNLFQRAERHFSHGCVRLAQPLELAKYVLREQPKWTEEKIKAAMNGGIETTAMLDEAIPVHIVYLTALAAPDGTVQFLKDIYNLDDRSGE